MNPLLLAGGWGLVVFAMMDALWTILWTEGHGGPFARHLSQFANRLMVLLLRPLGHHLMSIKGAVLLILSMVSWTLMMWCGWTLVLSAAPGAVVHADTRAATTVVERAYFVGYTMFTMGNGDFAPVGGVWQLTTALASFSGLVMITLLVTYLLSVLEAVVQKRAFATQVYALGRRAEDFVRAAWDGQGFRAIELQLISLTQQLSLVTQQHQAYPMLHFHHATKEHEAIATAIAVFDDALAILSHGVVPGVRPAPALLYTASATVHGFLETLSSAYVKPSPDEPPPLALGRVRAAGIPLVDDAEFSRALRERDSRRRLILALVQSERRDWPLRRDEQPGPIG